ncbi:MAG: gfo/Idh/MocA family oxidoreductase, partial [Pararhizobium sp.]
LGQRAGSRAGAMSVLCGIAALSSANSGSVVRLADLMPEFFSEQSERVLKTV